MRQVALQVNMKRSEWSLVGDRQRVSRRPSTLRPLGAGILLNLAAPLALDPPPHLWTVVQAPGPEVAQMARAFAQAGFCWAPCPQVVCAVAIDETYDPEPGCFLADVPHDGQFMNRLETLDDVVDNLRVGPLAHASNVPPTCWSCPRQQMKRSDEHRLANFDFAGAMLATRGWEPFLAAQTLCLMDATRHCIRQLRILRSRPLQMTISESGAASRAGTKGRLAA